MMEGEMLDKRNSRLSMEQQLLEGGSEEQVINDAPNSRLTKNCK